MLHLFEMIRTFVNSIPPCNVINCVPDRIENAVIQFLTVVENWLANIF